MVDVAEGNAAEKEEFYCYMNGCKVTSGTFGYQYRWYANNHIKVEWRQYGHISNPSATTLNFGNPSLQSTYDSTHLFGIANFGEPHT